MIIKFTFSPVGPIVGRPQHCKCSSEKEKKSKFKTGALETGGNVLPCVRRNQKPCFS